MRTRTRYIIAVILTLAVVAIAVVAMWPPQPGVTQANFDRIAYGMTLAEVEAIFGRPPDVSWHRPHQDTICHWTCPSGHSTYLLISETEGVFGKNWPEADETITRKIRRWLSRHEARAIK
jgi:membrane-associated phospholipid phosphatase